jgi:hypothetical protein
MHRVFHKADGGVAVMHFATEDPELIERDTKSFLDSEPGATFVENAPFPVSRRFRNCWTKGAAGVEVHMDKARAQVLAEVRVKRDAALAATDGQMLKAQEQGANTKDLAVKRQTLRDLPAAVEAQLAALATPEDLEAFQPDGL